MTTVRIDSRIAKLDAAFNRAGNLDPTSEVRSDFAKYLCVLVSGFLERSVESILIEHVRSRSAKSVLSYVEQTLRAGNLNTHNLLVLVGRFDADAKERLEQFLDDERRDAINSIYGNRNSIAHGDDVSLTYVRVKGYHEKTREVVRFLENALA